MVAIPIFFSGVLEKEKERERREKKERVREGK